MDFDIRDHLAFLRRPRKQRLSYFREVDPSQQGLLLYNLSRHVQKSFIAKLDDHELVRFLNYLDPDKATDIIQGLPKARSSRITKELNDQIREKTEFLLKFNPRTAAGLMSLDYVLVPEESSFEDIFPNLHKHEKRTGKFPTILVVKEGKLVGELPGNSLVIHARREKISNFIKRTPQIQFNEKVRKVVDTFLKHPHDKVVVKDENNTVIGVINSDDIIRYMDKHTDKGLYDFAGLNEEEDALDSALTKVRYRYKWLIINLGTAFLAASVVSLFESTIESFVLLAVYMPIVAGMGGNSGTQAMAVMIRGLTLKQVDKQNARRVVLNEMIAGAINGTINGLIVALIAVVFNKNPLFGIVIGVSMVINLIIAGLFGALIPIILKRLKKDPAASATIFITTATDVCGFFVFLGLASIVMR